MYPEVFFDALRAKIREDFPQRRTLLPCIGGGEPRRGKIYERLHTKFRYALDKGKNLNESLDIFGRM